MTPNDAIHMTRLCDYQAPAFTVKEHHLTFVLNDGKAQVRHQQLLHRMTEGAALELFGENLTLTAILLDGQALAEGQWHYDGAVLRVDAVPEECTLETWVELDADQNLELSGLYRSNGIYCTQCEAQGFRRISFALDRPDVLAPFWVRIEADRETCPVLLSNGNLIAEGDLAEGRHFAEWHDPHPKPCYLFALVAGQLAERREAFTTPKGKTIALHIYTEAAFIAQSAFAMDALKRAITWDERRFGLQYDLDRFNIVAISDFNMGAMENKSLNIFNTCYILGDTTTASDSDFHGILAVIGHEYFHNWTGDRITCRDWFQLSLKEGLTVFREQEFSSDEGERDLERIANVNILRRVQFAEDASPLRHPVQPQEYAAIDNFYTATVYEKGAEIIRMYHTILGEKDFQKGMALYVDRHDGQAVRIEEFAQCMEDASGFPFSQQFFRWYTCKGTPELDLKSHYDPARKTLTLTAKQRRDKIEPAENLLIPIRFALIDKNAAAHVFADGQREQLWLLEQEEETRVIENVAPESVPVWLLGFSAPVLYHYDYSDEELVRIAKGSDDGFARFEAVQTLYRRLFKTALEGQEDRYQGRLARLVHLLGGIFADPQRSYGEKALMLVRPGALDEHELPEPLDMAAILRADARIKDDLAQALAPIFAELSLPVCEDPNYSKENAQVRQWVAAVWLQQARHGQTPRSLFAAAYHNARNMSERMGALSALMTHYDAETQAALDDFATRFAVYPLVIDKWFALQASATDAGALARIEALAQREDFTVTNPNRFRALVAHFARNIHLFHAEDGSGYAFLGAQIRRVLTQNPQLAARMIQFFAIGSRLNASHQALIAKELRALEAVPEVSVDVREMLSRILGALS